MYYKALYGHKKHSNHSWMKRLCPDTFRQEKDAREHRTGNCYAKNIEKASIFQVHSSQAISLVSVPSYLQVLHSFLMQWNSSNLRGVLHMYTLLNHPSTTSLTGMSCCNGEGQYKGSD